MSRAIKMIYDLKVEYELFPQGNLESRKQAGLTRTLLYEHHDRI